MATGTVIDRLIVEFGLDPKQFTKGQGVVLADMQRLQDEAKRRAKDAEESTRKTAMFFGRLRREAIGLLATVAGAGEIKQFIGNLVTGDAAVGRFARSTGLATSDVAKWNKAVELAGGSIEGGAGAIASLNDQIQSFQAGLGGNILPIYNQMAAEGGHVIDINASLINQLKAIAANAQAIESKRAGRGGFYLRQLGLNEDAINVLIRGDGYLTSILDKAEKLGAATKKDTDAAEEFLNKWRTLGQLIEGIFRPLESTIGDAVDRLNNLLRAGTENQKQIYDGSRGTPHEAAQDRLDGWMHYLFGTKRNEALPPPPTGAAGGGITGGLGFKILGFESAGAATAAASSVVSSRSNSNSEVNINGPITITATATDANGIAENLSSALADVVRKRRLAAQANQGQE